MSTNVVSAKEIKRQWHLVDAKSKTLGRLASDVAQVLMGKNKPNWVPYLDMGDFVVVVNADKVKVSGKKETAKKYYRHSGYPGGLRTETLSEVRAKKPEELIRHAVGGMVPKTKLGRQIIKKLHIYAGTEHPYKRQLKEEQKDAE